MPTTTTTPWSAKPPKSDETTWYQDQGYQWTPNGWRRPNDYIAQPGQIGGNRFYGFSSEAYPDRTLPSWYPAMGEITDELSTNLGQIPGAFDTSGYAKEVDAQTGRISTTAKSAANAAAAEYANRARQAGGSAEGAGLIKAQGLVKGQAAVGDIKLEAARYEIEQREKAATQASLIAFNLGNLRNDYLSTLAGYASREDALMAEDEASKRAKTAARSPMGALSYSYGTGPGGAGGSDFQSIQQAEQYFRTHQNQMTPYGWSGDWGG
jgi:hypothetical protein